MTRQPPEDQGCRCRLVKVPMGAGPPSNDSFLAVPHGGIRVVTRPGCAVALACSARCRAWRRLSDCSSNRERAAHLYRYRRARPGRRGRPRDSWPRAECRRVPDTRSRSPRSIARGIPDAGASRHGFASPERLAPAAALRSIGRHDTEAEQEPVARYGQPVELVAVWVVIDQPVAVR
jgi:hypothetical protein